MGILYVDMMGTDHRWLRRQIQIQPRVLGRSCQVCPGLLSQCSPPIFYFFLDFGFFRRILYNDTVAYLWVLL